MQAVAISLFRLLARDERDRDAVKNASRRSVPLCFEGQMSRPSDRPTHTSSQGSISQVAVGIVGFTRSPPPRLKTNKLTKSMVQLAATRGPLWEMGVGGNSKQLPRPAARLSHV